MAIVSSESDETQNPFSVPLLLKGVPPSLGRTLQGTAAWLENRCRWRKGSTDETHGEHQGSVDFAIFLKDVLSDRINPTLD